MVTLTIRAGPVAGFTITLPAGASGLGKMLDLVMLTLTGGRERSEAEYAALLAAAGFTLTRVVPTASQASVIEAVPSASV